MFDSNTASLGNTMFVMSGALLGIAWALMGILEYLRMLVEKKQRASTK